MLRRVLGPWSALRAFNRLPADERAIVFYAEGSADWPHLGPIVEELTAAHGRTLCYVTSEENDPVFALGDPRIRAFCIGSGAARTSFFRLVDARVVVMTLPDLETYHLKRSVHPVHYVYVFHSIVSSHMTYRKGAFDAYDTVLCVGPHHVDEIRRTEEVYGLRPKALVEHGYARLDRIVDAASRRPVTPSGGASKRVLLAPSWGTGSYVEAPYGQELIEVVLAAGHSVVLRLHPMTVRRFPKLAPTLAEAYRDRPFQVETDMNAQESLHRSDLMIADWSGAALEYAFGLERPVLFIDTPRKVNNPEYERIGRVPLEVSVRREIGAVIDPADLGATVDWIQRLSMERDAFRERLREVRDRSVYNLGRSAVVGAAHVARLADTAAGSLAGAGASRRTGA
ncbi:MAG TPA: CDP-glycerol glycerophosphotransferase family protein [Candidatus Limnocylindria bacterium]|nr:CDP-glycerol glycerophosphotransferase family protein [Candidatus Limnocylindria bacterium]